MTTPSPQPPILSTFPPKYPLDLFSLLPPRCHHLSFWPFYCIRHIASGENLKPNSDHVTFVPNSLHDFPLFRNKIQIPQQATEPWITWTLPPSPSLTGHIHPVAPGTSFSALNMWHGGFCSAAEHLRVPFSWLRILSFSA